MNAPLSLNRVFRALLRAYGPQHWWPGDTPFEIAIGAILTQNVAWTNVETAIAQLKEKRLLAPRALDAIPAPRIAPLIRSTGYYNQKAIKLKNFLAWFAGYRYSFARLHGVDTERLRRELLAVSGIGPETADSILLYALGRKLFVVDAYTVRLLGRLGIIGGGESYHDVQGLFHRRFRGGVGEYNEFHALIVNHGKYVCRTRPRCAECCLSRRCLAYHQQGADAAH
ncbi:MAG TPA: hypothetical protein PLE73_07165, partial [Spirochaetota bacterium]|nr:hypothetical protein [Spirochaetota bacterium]